MKPLVTVIRLLTSALCIDSNIANDLDIRLDLTQLQIMLKALAKVSEKAFMSFPIGGKS